MKYTIWYKKVLKKEGERENFVGAIPIILMKFRAIPTI
jgi:hypothetical protein